MIKKFLISLIIFSFFFSFISAYDTYDNYSANSGFSDTSGLWNNDLDITTVSSVTRGLSSPNQAPLFDDIDNDGEIEIIVFDDKTLKIYESSTLDIEDGLTFLYDLNSNIIIQDLDSDGLKDIIFILDGHNITRVEWNNSAFNTTVLDATGILPTYFDWSMVGCRSNTECMASFHHDNMNYFAGFDSTGILASINYNDTDARCPNSMQSMTIADFDGDNEAEFILSYYVVSAVGVERGMVDYFSLSVGLPIRDLQIIETLGELTSESNCGARALNHYAVTNPVVIDFDGLASNGLETIIGLTEDNRIVGGNYQNEFRMYSYYSDGSDFRDYPEFVFINTVADGTYLSNAVVMDEDSSSGRVEVCVLGFGGNFNVMDLLCASGQGSDVNGDEYFYTNAYNNTPADTQYWHLITSVDYDQGNGQDELVTTYGVMDLGNDQLNQIYENTKQYGAYVPADLDSLGFSDFLVLTNTNLWYINDGYSASDCQDQTCIVEITTNPSIDTIMKINTTFHVTVEVSDVDNDLVSAKVVLYAGTSNEQDTGWTINASSEGQRVFSFTELQLNQTINNGVMEVYARDTTNPANYEQQDFTFTVALEGSEFGDGVFEYTGTVTTDDADTDGDDTAVSSLMGLMEDETNLGATSLWLILMSLVPVVLIYLYYKSSGSSKDLTTSLIILGVTELFLMVLGVRFGFIDIVWIITLAVLSLGGFAVFISKSIFANRQ